MSPRRVPVDLAAMFGFALLAPAVFVIPTFRVTPVRFIIGIPLVLFVPGYVLVSALYPGSTHSNEIDTEAIAGDTGIHPLERIALSFVFSMAIVSIIGLILNSTPFGLRLIPVVVALSSIIIILILIAYQRRQILTPEHRFVVPWRKKLQAFQTDFLEPDSKTNVTLNVLLVASISLAVISTGYVLTTPTEGEAYTEFYILPEGEELDVEAYPTEFVAGESKSLVVGITNQEYQTMDYTVLIGLQRVRVQDNSTQVLASERLDSFETRIEHNETWQQTHAVTPQMTGKQLRLSYTLYRGDPPASPTTENAYRELQLLVNVTSEN